MSASGSEAAAASRGFALPRARAVWVQVHLWTGLTLGLVVALVGLSGSLLVFAGPMIRAEQGAIVAPEPSPLAAGRPWTGIDRWIANTRARHPELAGIEYVLAPDAAPVPSAVPLLVGHVHAQGPEGEEVYEGHQVVGIDPVRGEPLGTFLFEDTWTGLLMSFHAGLLAGTVGDQLVVWSSLLALTVSVGSGLYLWWPRSGGWRLALTLKKGARGRRRLLDLHNVGAVWLLAPLVLLLATGLLILRPQWFYPALQAASEIREPDFEALAAEKRPDCGRLGPEAALALALRDYPGWRLRMMSIPEERNVPYYVGLMREGGDAKVMATELWIDRACPTVLFARRGDALTAAETLLSWNLRLHADLGLGLIGKALVFLAGLLLPALWVTGLLLWVGRRRAKRAGERRRAAA